MRAVEHHGALTKHKMDVYSVQMQTRLEFLTQSSWTNNTQIGCACLNVIRKWSKWERNGHNFRLEHWNIAEVSICHSGLLNYSKDREIELISCSHYSIRINYFREILQIICALNYLFIAIGNQIFVDADSKLSNLELGT